MATTTKTDYSSLSTKLSASKLQTTNPNLYQTVNGLITGAKSFTDFANSAFDSINGTFTSFTSALDSINSFITDLTNFVKFQFGVVERLRQLPLGEWYAVTYDAGLFTSAGVWAVGAGDVLTLAYELHGKTCTYAFKLNTTSISGAPASVLSITLPVTIIASLDIESVGFYADTVTTERVPFRVIVAAGGTTISLVRLDDAPWPTSTNAAYFFGTITFAIQ